MKVLVLNAGSSSLKYQLLDLATNTVLIRGLCENIGLHDSAHRFDRGYGELKKSEIMNDHHDALQVVVKTLIESDRGPIKSLDEIDAVGHRVVSGGEFFTESTLIDDDVLEKIGVCSELPPLHNPPALMAMYACLEMMPGKPEVAVFDTAFFQTLPPRAYVYPLPYEYYTDYKIRKYGAHGTSHRFIARHAAKMLGADVRDLRLITCHLGNGASIAAVDHGVAVDTTMGLTPLDGLMMGTRCGTIDPAVVTRIQTLLGYTPEQMNEIMNKKSGLLAVSGLTNDIRDIIEASEQGNERARLALDMFCYSARRNLGAMWAAMGGVDTVVFTAGAGQNSPLIRAKTLEGMEGQGFLIDPIKNAERHKVPWSIAAPESAVRIIVVPAGEEYMIALDVKRILER